MYQYEKRNIPFNDCSEIEHCCANPCAKYRSGFKVCINCGTILEQKYVKKEQRAYTNEEVKERKQTEPLWREFGPRTILPSTKVDSKGIVLNPKDRLLYSRLSKIQRSLVNSLERNFWEAKPKLKQYASKLNIPRFIVETAWRIYCEVAKSKLTVGRSIDGFIAASLYAAIRIHEFPKILDDIADASMVPNHTMFRSLGIIIREVLPILHLKYQPISSEMLTFLFGNKLGLPLEKQIEAVNLLKNVLKKGLIHIGKDPKGLAAAVLYIVAKNTEFKKTQVEVAKAAKVTEVTIRSRLKDISLLLGDEIW